MELTHSSSNFYSGYNGAARCLIKIKQNSPLGNRYLGGVFNFKYWVRGVFFAQIWSREKCKTNSYLKFYFGYSSDI